MNIKRASSCLLEDDTFASLDERLESTSSVNGIMENSGSEEARLAMRFVLSASNDAEQINKALNGSESDRPYEGQPHTVYGARGATLLKGVTMRDVVDCFVRGAIDASNTQHMSAENHNVLFDLDWDDLDPMAVMQNMGVELEKLMGIYPNVPELQVEEEQD